MIDYKYKLIVQNKLKYHKDLTVEQPSISAINS